MLLRITRRAQLKMLPMTKEKGRNIMMSGTIDSLTNIVKDKIDSKIILTSLLIEFLKVATSKLSSHPGREIIQKQKSFQHVNNRIIFPSPVINDRKDVFGHNKTNQRMLNRLLSYNITFQKSY